MHKKGLGQGLGLVLITVIFFLITVIAVNAEEETITITTYYPSPYGSYRELRSMRMAIGNTWYEGANVCWDDGGTEPTCTGMGGQMEILDSVDADLVVEGNVGIGTAVPGAKLELYSSYSSATPGDNPALRFKNQDGSQFGFRQHNAGSYYTLNLDRVFGSWTTPVITFTTPGNVGIGTASPGAKLEVAGTIRATSGTPIYQCPSGDPDYPRNMCVSQLSTVSTCLVASGGCPSGCTVSCILAGRMVAP